MWQPCRIARLQLRTVIGVKNTHRGRRGKLQRLRSKWGHVRHGVTNRVATTISNIRDKSYAYAGFPTARPLGSQDESSDPADLCRARCMQLRNTIVRALLVDEVNYEPSSRLKKSRKAVVLITGADLVLVKMTSMTKAGSTISRSSSTPPDGAAGASRNSSTYAASAGGVGTSRRLDSGFDAAAAVAADARASVLAQHELNKMVKCEVSGDRLDLEFIVTGGAQFKVSAAALGLNTANVSTLPSSSTMTSSSMGRQSAKLDEEYEGLDAAAAAADVLPIDAAGLGRRSGSGSGGQQQQAHSSAQDKQQGHMSPRSSTSSPAMLSSRTAQAEAASAHDQGGRQDAPAASAASSSGDMDLQDHPSPGGSGTAALLDDSAYHRANSGSFDMSTGAPAATALGSRTLARFINRYSSYSSSGTFPAGSPPVVNGMSLSAAAGVAGKSFVRGLGSRTMGAADEGARSSCRPVKTDDGEYLVWVESFSLTFSNPSLAEMAAELLRAGRSTMRQAIDWLKQGLPFSPEFAVTHITQLSSRAGDEELRAGPTPWGTVLQLPDSWVEAVSDAQLPDEQPLSTALEVADGPAAFKVHLATPAGLAEATLLPELIAVLSQQPCTHGQVLAVPVDLTLQITAADAQQAQEQQQQQPAAKASSTGSSRGTSRGMSGQRQTGGGADSAGNATSSSKSHAAVSTEGSPSPAAAGSREPVPAADKQRAGSQRELTWADQQQQVDSAMGADVAPMRRSTGGGAGAAFEPRAASCTTVSGAAKGMHHSRSMPQLGKVEQLLPEAASAEFDSWDETDLWAEQDVQQAQQVAHGIHLRRADSSSSLPDLQSGHRGVSTDSWKGDAAIDPSTAGTASATAESVAEEQRPGFGGLSGISRQQSGTQLSFAAEVHAVLHVRLLLDTEDGSSSVLAAACVPAQAPAGPQISSPFAAGGGVSGLDDAALPLSDGGLQMQHTIIQQPSILLLGAAHTGGPTAEQQQIMQTAVALLAALLCGCALLLRSTGAAAVLVLCAALVNMVCMAAALHPALFRRPGRFLQRVLRLQQTHSSHAHAHSNHHHHHHHHHSSSHHGLKRQHSKGSTAGAGPGQHRSGLSQQRKLQGLRLQLLGGSFVKEALGLLEQQILAFRDMQESPDSCSVSYVSGYESDDLESVSSEDEEMCEAVFVSSPEPAWLTRDWRRRLWQARPTMEERSKLSGIIHAWRESVGADTILQRDPAKFDWFHKNLVLRPLLKTQQGHVVVLLKLSTLANMHRVLTAAGLSPGDLMLHCAFLWCWMFEEYARGDWPQGRFVLLADMSGLKLGQAVGEGQIGGRALGEVCNAFPERLTRCLVLGAPNWFNMLFRLIRPQLSPSTRAKVQVCTTPAETVAELACCLGSDWVPAEYGGPCAHPYDEFPAQKVLLQHVAQLRQQAP